MSTTGSHSSAAGFGGQAHGESNVRPAGWPGALPLDVEGYPTAPSGLELQQVHIYVRHGERTPVGIRMSEPPASIPEHWMLCKNARRFKAAVTSTMSVGGREFTGEDETLPVRKVVERVDGSVADGECLLGELTDIGRQTTYNLGYALRRLYVDKLGFLPDSVHSNDEAYFRTTNIPRTTESLEQIIHGLYPAEKCANGFVPQLRIRNGRDENLFGNTLACKRLEVLQIGFAKAAAQTWNSTLEPLDEKISKYIGGNPIRLDGKPRASGILDTVKAAQAHSISVPGEFKEKGVLDVIVCSERAVVQEWFAGYKTEEVRRLGMGRLLSDLTRKMSSKAEKEEADKMKILVHSTHDTALAGLCSTLDVFDDRWPSFSAAITFELFHKRSTEDLSKRTLFQTVLSPFRQPQITTEHFVRMRYQNRNMVLPICSEEGNLLGQQFGTGLHAASSTPSLGVPIDDGRSVRKNGSTGVPSRDNVVGGERDPDGLSSINHPVSLEQSSVQQDSLRENARLGPRGKKVRFVDKVTVLQEGLNDEVSLTLDDTSNTSTRNLSSTHDKPFSEPIFEVRPNIPPSFEPRPAAYDRVPDLLDRILQTLLQATLANRLDQDRAIAWVLIAIVVIGFSLYALAVLFSLISSDCPFHSPIADWIWEIWPYATYPFYLIGRSIRRHYRMFKLLYFPAPPEDSLALLKGSLPTPSTSPRARNLSLPTPVLRIVRRLRPRRNRKDQGLGWITSPTTGLAARCVDWLLLTSTDSDVITTAARMAVEVNWPAELDIGPMATQLRDAFVRCFVVRPDEAFYLLPHARDRAAACGQALLHSYMQRRQLDLAKPPHNTHNHIEQKVHTTVLLRRDSSVTRGDTDWLVRYQSSIGDDDPDLQIICWALSAFSSSPVGFATSAGAFSHIPPSPMLMEWFADNALYCLYDPRVVDNAKLRLGAVFAHFLELSPLPSRDVLISSMKACALLIGAEVKLEQLPIHDDGTDEFKHYLELTLVHLDNVTQRNSPRLQLRRGILRDLKSDFARILLKPLMDMLIQLNAAERFRDVLYQAEFHHWCLRLCRQLVFASSQPEQLAQRLDWSSEFQPTAYYIRQCIHMSILTASSSNLPSNSSVVARVWNTRYNRTENNPDPVLPTDYSWLISLANDARMHPERDAHVDLVTDCLVLLCEINNIGFRHDHHPGFFATLLWATGHAIASQLRQAGLRLTRVLTGSQREVNGFLLRSVVDLVGGDEAFCDALAATSPFRTCSEVNVPTSYCWSLAYLDLLNALCLRDEWLTRIQWLGLVQECVSFAVYLSTPVGRQSWHARAPDVFIVPSCIGWSSDTRPWKQIIGTSAWVSPNGFGTTPGNSYVRDIWFRLIQIAVLSAFARPEPPNFIVDVTNNGPWKLVIACTAWHILDTHPLPPEIMPIFLSFAHDAFATVSLLDLDTNQAFVKDARLILERFCLTLPFGSPFASGASALLALMQARLDEMALVDAEVSSVVSGTPTPRPSDYVPAMPGVRISGPSSPKAIDYNPVIPGVTLPRPTSPKAEGNNNPVIPGVSRPGTPTPRASYPYSTVPERRVLHQK
ncbi:hypothetical protein EIP91_011930 [Steccherinum ochraceum]|uniref:Uncharacterized protein n=1 Tax=Steccherinum ochraceum TaxID=92696 RepID=A0A4R0RKY7_9APHY|nr:hypothetical protein EIP91_011930 [Steccherinum ochraceum]